MADSNPERSFPIDPSEWEQQTLAVMTGDNISMARTLFEARRAEVDLALEHLPEFYGGPIEVKDDERHQELLKKQLLALGAFDLVLEEPYLTGHRRLFHALLPVDATQKQTGLDYWLDEQHTIDLEIGPALRLRAFRKDPRELLPEVEKAREMQRKSDERSAKSLSRFVLDPPRSSRPLVRH